MTVNVVERAKTWETFVGSWSEFLRAENPKAESDFTKVLRQTVKFITPEARAYQNARCLIWKRRRKDRRVKA